MPAILPRFDLGDPTDALALSRRLVNASNNTLVLGPNPNILLDTWLIEYTLGQILMLLLMGTLLWKRRTIGNARSWRGLTLINMLLTMFLNCTVNLILYYSGESANPNPPTGLCLVQATLRHGTGPMTEVAIMSLAIETFLSTRGAITMKKPPVGLIVLLLVLPYFSFFLWGIPIAVMGSLYPFNIERLDQAYYCSYANNPFGDVCTLYGVIAILITAVIQGFTARFLHRTWRATRTLRASGGIDFGLVVRIWVFTGLQILFIILTVIDLFLEPASARRVLGQAIEVFQSFVPVIAFVLFGLRASILEVWFWWWPRSPSTTMADSSVAFNSYDAPTSSSNSSAPSGMLSPMSPGRKEKRGGSGGEGEKAREVYYAHVRQGSLASLDDSGARPAHWRNASSMSGLSQMSHPMSLSGAPLAMNPNDHLDNAVPPSPPRPPRGYPPRHGHARMESSASASASSTTIATLPPGAMPPSPPGVPGVPMDRRGQEGSRERRDYGRIV